MDICFNLLKQQNKVYEIAKRMKDKGIDIEMIAECTRLDKELIERLI